MSEANLESSALPGPILLVAPEPFYVDRGTPIAIREVLRALSQNGREVHLITYPMGQEVELPGVRLFRVPRIPGIRRVPIGFSFRKVFLDQLLLAAMARRLWSSSYACIHAVEEMGFPAVVLGRMAGVPVLWDMQSDMPEQMKKHRIFRIPLVQALLRRCEAWLIKRADFIACSGGLEPQIRAVRPDVPIREWRFPGQRRCCPGTSDTVTRESLGIPAEVPVVCYAGNFEHYQGVDLLIQGAKEVLKEMPETVFLLLGAEEGQPLPRGADPLVAAGSMKVVSRKPRESVPRYLALADVTVSPRCVDGNIPLKIFDYMVSGIPMVATDIACHRTVLGDDKAVLVETSGEGVARGILRVLQDREEAAALGRAARTHAEEHLSWLAFSQDVARLHKDVVRLHKFEPGNPGDPGDPGPGNPGPGNGNGLPEGEVRKDGAGGNGARGKGAGVSGPRTAETGSDA